MRNCRLLEVKFHIIVSSEVILLHDSIAFSDNIVLSDIVLLSAFPTLLGFLTFLCFLTFFVKFMNETHRTKLLFLRSIGQYTNQFYAIYTERTLSSMVCM